LDWEWNAMTGWQPLVDYIDPKGATGRKHAVQVYAVSWPGDRVHNGGCRPLEPSPDP
jgi:hypothetical protein